mmetsp:Transcript_39706/g.100028  ORF Transcript_39706/g.100028 Transcript_39706/m.100028 type:complete len:695 (-) Transcript_39706:184-2268(-)
MPNKKVGCCGIGCGVCALFTGFIIILLALIIGGVLIETVDSKLDEKIVISSKDDSEYDNWITNTDHDDTPLYYEFYFYNITNLDEVKRGLQVKMKETGPYWYRIWQRKLNVEFLGENRVQYLEQEWYEFDPERSQGRSNSDIIVMPNPAYVNVMRALGSEFNLKMLMLGRVMAGAYDQVLERMGGNKDLLASFWGNFSFPGNNDPSKLDFGASGGYLSLGEFILDNAGNTTSYGDYTRVEALNVAPAAAADLLFGDNGFLEDDTAARTFYSLAVPCIDIGPANFNSTPECRELHSTFEKFFSHIPDDYSEFLAVVWVSEFLYQFQNTIVDDQLQQILNAGGGGLFAARTVEEWMIKHDDPFLSLLGRPSFTFLCNNNGSKPESDPCKRGLTGQYTGADSRQRAREFWMDRSMTTVDPFKGKFCDPFSDCNAQGAGIWGGELTVRNKWPGLQDPAEKDGWFGWDRKMVKGNPIGMWSQVLFREIFFDFIKEQTYKGVATVWRYDLMQETGAVSDFYFISIEKILNMTTVSRGLPLLAVPSNLVTFDVRTAVAFLNVQLTLRNNCTTGLGYCKDVLNKRNEFGTWLVVEPNSGATLEIHERVTYILTVCPPVDGVYSGLYRGTHTLNNCTLFPLFAADKTAAASEEDAADLDYAITIVGLGQAILVVGIASGLFIFLLGVIFLVVGVIITKRASKE